MDGFLRHKLLPALLSGLTISILALFFNSVSFALVFASFGSSAFIIYAFPKSESAQMGDIIPAYFLSSVAGYVASFLLPSVPVAAAAGAAVFLSAFLMLAFGKKHAPACGIGLAFVIFRLSTPAIIISLLGGVFLIIVARLLSLMLKEERSIQKSAARLFR
jgi:CBS-domain-containing membrane protein